MSARARALSWAQRSPAVAASVLAFLAASVGGGISFGLAALDGEKRRDVQLTAILRPEYQGEDRLAPDFTLRDHRGQPFRLSSLRGKTVVLQTLRRRCTDAAPISDISAPSRQR